MVYYVGGRMCTVTPLQLPRASLSQLAFLAVFSTVVSVLVWLFA